MKYTAQCRRSKDDTVEVSLYACGVSIRCNEGGESGTIVLDIEQVQELQTVLTTWLQQRGDVSC